MIRNDDVVMNMTALTVDVRRYYYITVRRDTAGEFQTGEMCKLNIEGIIFVEFIRVEGLNNQLRLIFALRVPCYFANSLANKLLRRSVWCRADNAVGCGAHIVVAHVLVRAVDRVHRGRAYTFRSLNFGY